MTNVNFYNWRIVQLEKFVFFKALLNLAKPVDRRKHNATEEFSKVYDLEGFQKVQIVRVLRLPQFTQVTSAS